MRKENGVLVLAATVACGLAVTLLQAQETSRPRTEAPRKVGKSLFFGERTGSPYVELDSWIYAALERLAALGYIHSAFSDMRPWTRVECARMVKEAGTVLEFQHAPSAAACPLAARQAIATADSNPLQPATPFPGVDQFRLIDTYAAANVGGWDLSFGKQSLWWAPNRGGALLFSDNAEPIYMARVSRMAPFELPWILRFFGPMKWDLFFGKLSGNQYPTRPLIHGETLGSKPTKNLEISFSL